MAIAEGTSTALPSGSPDGIKAPTLRIPPLRKSHTTSFARDERPSAGDRPPIPVQQRTNSLRAASFRTDSSSRMSMGTADTLLLPRATLLDEGEHLEEPSLWYSAPLLFAVLPAIGGVAFNRGSIFLTDLALLLLAALYLHWCLMTPWIWYHAAQVVKVQPGPEGVEDLEDTEEAVVDSPTSESPRGESPGGDSPDSKHKSKHAPKTRQGARAAQELRLHELTALTLCFLGPLLGSYVLHIIRTQLSTIGDQLVSNLHLTLFVLAAEIRPLRYAIKMAQARTLFLQRVVREDPHVPFPDSGPGVQDLRQRLDEVETAVAKSIADAEKPGSKTPSADSDVLKKIHTSVQTQIDALNRAVRRYEKRATAQTIQTEVRLQDLDLRLREAVSLAAAAATYSQRPGLVVTLLNGAKSAVTLPFSVAYTAITYPIEVANDAIVTIALRTGLVRRKSVQRPARPIPKSKTALSGLPRKAIN